MTSTNTRHEPAVDQPAADGGRGHQPQVSRRAMRSSGVLSLILAIISAVALTGAAFATVAQAGCEIPGHYVQNAGKIEFVGGCVTGTDLPEQHRSGSVTDAIGNGTSHSSNG